MRKRQKAQALLLREDADYAKFMKDQELQAEETVYKRQGELLASLLRDKFDQALAQGAPGGTGGGEARKAASQEAAVVPKAVSVDEAAGFSPGQLEQLKSIITSLVPTPDVPPEKASGSDRPAKGRRIVGKQGKTDDGEEPGDGQLSSLQLALGNSLFGGRVKFSEETTVEDFQKQCKAKWTQRAVPETIDNFLGEHLPDETVPKTKDARCALFWNTLSNLS